MNKSNIAALVVAIAGLAVSGFVYVQVPDSVDPAKPLGVLTGPDIPYDYLRWGQEASNATTSVRAPAVYMRSAALAQATSTICSVLSPAATTTLVGQASGVIFTKASTTAGRYQMWRGTSLSGGGAGSATTTFITGKLATAYIDSFMATSGAAEVGVVAGSNSSVANPMVFPPSTYLVFTTEYFTVPKGLSFAEGQCQGVFVGM